MLLTRCPTCRTAFRVTPEQLKARAGKVRCGHCKAVFNALETLDAVPNGGAPEPAPPREALEVRGEAPLDQETAFLVETVPEPALPPPAPPQEEAPALPEAWQEEETPAPVTRRSLIAWSLGLALATATLGLQATYIFRAELAAAQPGWRPLLEDWCAALGCEVPLPRTAELVSIEASDLHPDPKQPKLLVLAATLKNRAPFLQAYPHLELTLTDTADQPLARRVFAPEDYLPEGTPARAGFAPNADLAVSLWLDAASVGATGYRLYLFYP